MATECLSGAVPPRLHCAKRSSAALRTAVQYESSMKRQRVEGCTVDCASLSRFTTPRGGQQGDPGIASRVRRDAKNALEQRLVATACGDDPMIAVPIVGRAVRIYKKWYALCAYCGALTCVKPHVHRRGAEMCCLRCDHSTCAPVAGDAPSGAMQCCRFCGVTCEKPRVAGWREIKAPLDVAGHNATLPEPLRRVWYCRKCFRGWVTQAHRTLPTRVILAHLLNNAKPLYGADKSTADDKMREEMTVPKPKTRRMPKRRQSARRAA